MNYTYYFIFIIQNINNKYNNICWNIFDLFEIINNLM